MLLPFKCNATTYYVAVTSQHRGRVHLLIINRNVMKYPAIQFEALKKALIILNEYFDLHAMHLSTLHYIVYQQFSEGQTHNWFYLCNGEVKRQHSIADLSGCTKLVGINEPFELYPEGCNELHIETAVKRAIKEICCLA